MMMRKAAGMRRIVLTNARQYCGPGAVTALVESGAQVICHDAAFVLPEARKTFERETGAWALGAQTPTDIHSETLAVAGLPDAIVSNDVYPITRNAIEDIPLDDFRATFDAVVLFPIELTQMFLPAMKQRRSGAFVFVTSARETRPEPGFAVPTSLRAATTAFAKSLAKEAAPFGIQANVVAPNYLASELYYPRAKFVEDPAGRAAIAEKVPFGRLGEQDEVGALIAFFASGASAFTTGQVVYFSGGWP
jgi:NAD(P)-dependent dehydrogenase (short-subunit alcohol dehydrogenase family)